MSARVNVAVLGHLATMALQHGGEWEEIHDAVVELVEVTKLAREWIIEAGARTPTLPNSATLSKLHRVLDRVQGGA